VLASCYDSRKSSHLVANSGSRMPHIAVPQARKKALRQWFYQHQLPRPSLQACIHWFEAQYGHRLDKSMVSRYLSDSYSRLDSTTFPTLLNHTRSRPAQWPLLETILSHYCRTISSRGGLLTDDIMTERAHQIWLEIPEYEGQSMPEFSHG